MYELCNVFAFSSGHGGHDSFGGRRDNGGQGGHSSQNRDVGDGMVWSWSCFIILVKVAMLVKMVMLEMVCN